MDQARCDLGDNISYLLPHKKSPHNLAAYNNKHYLAVSVVRNSGMALLGGSGSEPFMRLYSRGWSGLQSTEGSKEPVDPLPRWFTHMAV